MTVSLVQGHKCCNSRMSIYNHKHLLFNEMLRILKLLFTAEVFWLLRDIASILCRAAILSYQARNQVHKTVDLCVHAQCAKTRLYARLGIQKFFPGLYFGPPLKSGRRG
jgi:hypothetical protein